MKNDNFRDFFIYFRLTVPKDLHHTFMSGHVERVE